VVAFNDQVRAFLDEIRFAVLATINPDGSPQQSILWYERQGDEIMMNTKRGRFKDRNLLRDRRVSFCVEDGYRYLVITGPVELIDDQITAQADIKRLSTRYHGPRKAERQMREQFSREERVTIRLTPRRIHAYGLS
jgi:PPOX class probable F420-dependent enzyme